MSPEAAEDQVTFEVVFTSTVRYAKRLTVSREQWAALNARIDAAEALGSRSLARIHNDLFAELGFSLSEEGEYDDPELDDLCEARK